MVPGPSASHEDTQSLSGARADFVATLGRRVNVLKEALAELESDPRSVSRRDTLLRRIHAMGAAARVLGFEAVADALSAAERALRRAADHSSIEASDLAEVSRALDQLPSLAWGAGVSVRSSPSRPPLSSAGEVEADLGVGAGPLSVLVFGSAALAEAFDDSSTEQPVELERTEEPARALELSDAGAPDVIIIDADRRGARALAEKIAASSPIEPAALIVVGTFDQAESASAYVALGAERVLPKPVSPDTLRRTVLAAAKRPRARGASEPIGDVTIEELGDRITAEVKRGLVEAADASGRRVTMALGDGADVLAAVWGALSRIRELVVMRTAGQVRFDPTGPEGAVPLAAWGAGERRAAGERRIDRVSLRGRRAVVVDDDPAVVWFISGLLRGAGMEVYEAHDGEVALELAFDRHPDLVVSDVLMPGIDGLALCREIKRDIAVRDVPVILLSWKEDLLARLRDLGTDADGYLRKETTGHVVLDRITEVLAPRARVESRLEAPGDVRGRLGGLTTRLLLELAAKHRPRCRVAIRDAVYLYEVELADGAPRRATRTAIDGSFERGERVIAPLLGISAGRFVVDAGGPLGRPELTGSLEELFREPIRRARAAQRALRSETLMRVDRIELDRDALAAYLPATPAAAARLIERLWAGESPRDLILSAEISPRLLEAVLSDVIRRGAVVRVLTGAAPASERPAPEAPAARDTEQERLFTFDLGAPVETDSIDAAWTDGAARVAELPLSRSVTPPIIGEPEAVADFGSGTRPGVGSMHVEEPAEPTPVSRPRAPATRVEPEEPSQPRIEIGEALDEAFAGLSDGGPDDDQEHQEEPMLDHRLPEQKRIEFPKDRRKADAPVIKPILRGRPLPREEPPDPEPVRTEPVRIALARVEPVRAEPAREEPMRAGPVREEPVREEPVREEPVREEPVREEPAREELVRAEPVREEPVREEPRAQRVERSREEASVRPQALPEAADRPMSAWRVALVTLLTAGASFALVRFLVAPTDGDEIAAAAPTTVQVPAAVPAPKKAEPAVAPAALKTEDLELSGDANIAPEKGLLELDTGEKHAIYVDGTFVGMGPKRRVPLDPGQHEVKLRLGGDETTHAVELRAGRRTRLSKP